MKSIPVEAFSRWTGLPPGAIPVSYQPVAATHEGKPAEGYIFWCRIAGVVKKALFIVNAASKSWTQAQ